MCGLAGFLSSELQGDAAPAVITSMLSLIHHRGPDEAGDYLADGLAMGGVWLSIVDSASHAPPGGGGGVSPPGGRRRGGGRPLADHRHGRGLTADGGPYRAVLD